jgi:uncharacterized protein involved in exopolysaccharide biosynthesis
MEKPNTTGFGLREHLTTLFRHKGKLMAIAFSTVIAAIVWSYVISPVFVSQSRILVQLSREPVRLTSGLGQSSVTQLERARDQVLTEVEIVRSPMLARQLAERLGPEYVLENMRWRWDWLRELPSKTKDSVKQALNDWQPSKTVLESLGIDLTVYPFDPLGEAAGKISDHLETAAILQTDVFAIEISAPSAEFAKILLDGLVDVYLEHHLSLRQPQSALEITDEELRRLKARLGEAEARLQAFKQEHRIVALDRQKALLLDRLNQIDSAAQDARKDLLASQQLVDEMERQLQQHGDDVDMSRVTSTSNPVADQLRSQIIELELERADFLDDSPTARQLSQEIEQLRTRLRQVSSEVMSTQTSGTSDTFKALRTALALERGNLSAKESQVVVNERLKQRYENELRELDYREAELKTLERDVEFTEQALRLFMRKGEEIRISETLDSKGVSNVVPIEPAVYLPSPVWPKRKLILLLAIFVGVSGGIGIAYLAEYLRRTFSNKEEIEEGLGKPVLASLLTARSHEQEAGETLVEFRRFREKIHQAKPADRPLTVFVTSAFDGEGKSYCSSGLAQSLLNRGERVLLVPLSVDPAVSQHATAATAPPPSPSKVTAGPGTATEMDVLRLTNVANAEIIHEIAARYRSQFDHIIFDAPSLNSWPEQLSLIEHADRTVFVVEANSTPGPAALKHLRLIEEAGAKVFGVVLNKRRLEIPDWAYHRFLSPSSSAKT